MKRVDENYSYDELKGFELAQAVRKRMAKDRIMATISRTRLAFSAAAVEALGYPEFVQIYFDADGQRMMVCKAKFSDESVRQVTATGSWKNGLNARVLAPDIERITKRDLSVARIYVTGTKARAKRDAVIFDLKDFEFAKKNSK